MKFKAIAPSDELKVKPLTNFTNTHNVECKVKIHIFMNNFNYQFPQQQFLRLFSYEKLLFIIVLE